MYYLLSQVISFGGGGGGLSYDTLLNYGDFKPIETEAVSTRGNEDDFSAHVGVDFSFQAAVVGFEVGLDVESGFNKMSQTTRVTNNEDNSHVGFHLQDPDAGDYFVVQIFRDPFYGTPLFFTNGGASSCGWEAGTAHRSAPTVKSKYVGPADLPPDQPALFELTLGNEINYYESGQDAIDRPNWVYHDVGYSPPTLALNIAPQNIANGPSFRDF